MHIMKCEEVEKPKKYGGLGLRKCSDMNKAYIVKLGLKMKTGEKSLSCNVIRGKFDRRLRLTDGIEAKSYDSSLWKSIVNEWALIESITF